MTENLYKDELCRRAAMDTPLESLYKIAASWLYDGDIECSQIKQWFKNVEDELKRKESEEALIEVIESVDEFVYDPATGFVHADDGVAPEHGIKWVRAATSRTQLTNE